MRQIVCDNISEKILVVGIGNVLMGDDGAGPHVIRMLLAKFEFPENVTVIDLGTPGLSLISYVGGYKRIIFVDTIRADGEPGELRIYNKEQLFQNPPPKRVSPHDPALHEAVMTADMLGEGPDECLLIGIIPERTKLCDDLSESMRIALPKAVQLILGELKEFGVDPKPACRSLNAELWWEVNPVA